MRSRLRKRRFENVTGPTTTTRATTYDPSFAEATATGPGRGRRPHLRRHHARVRVRAGLRFERVGGVSSGFTLAGAAANASAKVKRRCPYSFGPRSKLGPCPDRATEEAAWADVKAMEKASRAPGEVRCRRRRPRARRLGIGGVRRGGWMFAGSFDAALLPVAVGIGCVRDGLRLRRAFVAMTRQPL